jgi:DNA replication protein DnaC
VHREFVREGAAASVRTVQRVVAARRSEKRAAAILDRLLHYSHTFLIQGDSCRFKQKRKTGLVPKAK